MEKAEDAEVNDTTFDKLMKPVESKVASIEANRTPHHREVLSFAAFVRLLVYYFMMPNGSGRQLLTNVLSAAPELGLEPVKRSTFLRHLIIWTFDKLVDISETNEFLYSTKHFQIKSLGELTRGLDRSFKLPEPQVNSRICCKNKLIVG